jgi:ABC-2 type transport system permease protein
LLGSVDLTGRTEIAERIRSGDVAVDFIRPLDVHLASVTTEVGRSAFALLPRAVPSVAFGAEVVDLAVKEPDVEEVVRRVYAARR